MSIIKKILPTKLKDKIKQSMGEMDGDMLESVINDVASRKAEALVSTSINKKFLGQVVVVTGGSGYIGQKICERFANQGAIVFASGRSLDKVKNVFNDYKFDSGSILPCELDVNNEDSIKKLFKYISSKNKCIDILVNCAGGSARDEWHEIKDQSSDIIREVISMNLIGTVLCSKYSAIEMCKQNSGKIINIASTVGVGGKEGFSEYAASKAGVIGFTRSLAIELGKNNITVNCVTPGVVVRNKIDSNKIPKLAKKNVMNSFGIDNDIAYAVEFLASHEANFITGQNIIVDGGRSLGLKGD